MTKEEIALRLTLAKLDTLSYEKEFLDSSEPEERDAFVKNLSKDIYTLYNEIYKNVEHYRNRN